MSISVYPAPSSGGLAGLKADQILTPFSRNSVGVNLAAIPSIAAVSAVWPTANKAIFVPFSIDESVTYTKAFWFNGATVSGNVDIGIYDEGGTRKVSMGSTAQATINVLQVVDIADTTLAAGRYYMALAMDNITGTMMRTTIGGLGSDLQHMKAMGIAEQTAAFALPASATLATIASQYLPVFGFSIRTVV